VNENVIGWDDKAVEINFKEYCSFIFTFVSEGKLKKVEVYSSEVEELIPKFNELFQGKPWDDCVYYLPYGPIKCTDVYQVKVDEEGDEIDGDFIGEFRKYIPDGKDYGFHTVAKPDKFIVYVPGMFSR
jgi:hypothetical protein